MKSDVQKLKGLMRRVDVEIPQETVKAALDKMYKEVQRVAKFKGFRPGKAPIDMVRLEYRAKIENDVASQIIQDHYGKALDEHDLTPVNYPKIDFEGFTEGKPLKFSATFEIRPEIQLKKYENLPLEKEKIELKSELVDTIIEDIRKSKATMIPLIELRAAQMGDVAIVDFLGKIDGKDLEGGSGQEHPLELGANQFIPGFEEGVVGMNPNQKKTLNLKFPDDYNAKDIAGKNVEFDVTLKEIKRKVLPELDDEFAKSLGNHESLQHLKDEIKKDLEVREEKRVSDDLKARLFKALVDANDFEIPQTMMEEQKQSIIYDVQQRVKSQGMSDDQFEDYKKKWDSDFSKRAEFVVRTTLIINTIAKKEDLFATDEEMEERLKGYSQASGIEPEKIKAFYSKPESRSRLLFQMTEEKIVKFLLGKSQIKEVPRDKIKPLEE